MVIVEREVAERGSQIGIREIGLDLAVQRPFGGTGITPDFHWHTYDRIIPRYTMNRYP